MRAGFNCKGTIWRMTEAADDVVGGAVLTGTPSYTDVPLMVSAIVPTEESLIPGLETEQTYLVRAVPGTLLIVENDQIEITYPTSHSFYGKRFRILGVTPTHRHPQSSLAALSLRAVMYKQMDRP